MNLLGIASTTVPHSVTRRPTQGLRAAMGIGAVSGWYQTSGGRIAWQETPAGRTETQAVICLHDAGAGGREFRPLLRRRPAGCRFILIDWPGHGRSDDFSGDAAAWFTVDSCVAILDVLLSRIGVDKPILLGSGFGASVAIRYAATHPERVTGTVLCLPAGVVKTPVTSPFSQRGGREMKHLLHRMQKSGPGTLGSPGRLAARRQALRMEAIGPAMQPLRAAGRDSADSVKESLRQSLDSLACPALFALSRDSHEHPLRQYMEFLDPSLALAPKYRFTVFSGAFHPIWDEPDRFAVALSSFVQAHLPIEIHTHAWILHAVDWPAENNNLWKCVHPDCGAECTLPAGQDANLDASRSRGTPGRA